jgi:glycosyltransferase involved in cell wall biosynthesis
VIAGTAEGGSGGRLMLVHALAPPTPGGTPVVLQRLLTHLPGIGLEVVTNRRLAPAVRAGGQSVLPARYRFVWKWPGWGARWRLGRVAIAAIDGALAVVAGVRAARWARRDGVSWILSVTDEGFSVIAGSVAARLARLPHVVMVFDLWAENAYTDVQRVLARRLEPLTLGGADAVVGYCPELVEHLRERHGIEAEAIPTPVVLDDRTPPPEAPAPAAAPEHAARRTLLLAGAVYWAQRDAVARLLSLRGRIPNLQMVTVGNAEMLRDAGLTADRSEPTVPPEVLRRMLATADVLFLGLSLDSPYPAVVRTATPARLVEYMASGRPLLIHAPPDSHVARYARRENFAEVVDVADSDALLAGLRRVLDDAELARARAERGLELVRERHDAVRVGAAFARILAALDGGGRPRRRGGVRNNAAMPAADSPRSSR